MSKIEIKVKGQSGVGKSTVSTLIAEKLMEVGFDKVCIDLRDISNGEWFSNNTSRIQSICDSEIIITEE